MTPPNEAPASPHPASLREEVDRDLLAKLPRLAGVVGGVVAMFTISHPFLQPSHLARILVPVDGSTALVHLAVLGLIRTRAVDERWSHALVSLMVMVQTLNTGFELGLGGEPLLAVYFMVIAFVAALLLLDTRWFVACQVVVVATWVAGASWQGWPHELQRASLGIVTFTVFSAVMFTMRKRGLEREWHARANLAEKAVELANERDRADAANIAKSQFLANMSHELRTPLNAILGYAEMLREEAEDEGQAQAVEDLSRIDRAGRHLLGLINDLLDLSKIEAGHMELESLAYSLREQVEDVVATVRPLAEQGANVFDIDIDIEFDDMLGDPTRLRQCLLNLLSNAFKFTERGTVTLRVRATEVGGASGVALEVEDTGIGMTAEQSARVFDPFVQAEASTTRKYGGTGIGLAITRRLGRLMGGDVTVHSVPDQGTTFTLCVPRRTN